MERKLLEIPITTVGDHLNDEFLESAQIQHYFDSYAFETTFDKVKYPNAKPYVVMVRSPLLPGTFGKNITIANQLYEQTESLDLLLKSVALEVFEQQIKLPSNS